MGCLNYNKSTDVYKEHDNSNSYNNSKLTSVKTINKIFYKENDSNSFGTLQKKQTSKKKGMSILSTI